MINALHLKETITPLRDVITPVKHGTKHIINGLVKSNDAKTLETYLNFGGNKAIQSKEILFNNGIKATYSEKKTPNGILRVWSNGKDSKVTTISNVDGDLLSFKAKGHCTDMSGDEPILRHWAMDNNTHTHRKEFEIDRTKGIFNGFLNNYFKF